MIVGCSVVINILRHSTVMHFAGLSVDWRYVFGVSSEDFDCNNSSNDEMDI